jgi:RNA recognition motif-containing protein
LPINGSSSSDTPKTTPVPTSTTTTAETVSDVVSPTTTNVPALTNTTTTNTPVYSPTSVISSSVYTYNSQLNKPEAKKAKTQRTQPSKVVHIRNIPQQITEIEIIQFGLIFGNIANVLNLRSKCQAFLEFEKCEEAQSMINYFASNPISVAGRQIFVQYSNYKNLVTDPANTNNQVARAALDLAKDLHKAAQTGGSNTVLRAMIQNMLYGVSLDTLYRIFNRFGPVLKIITFTKNDKFQALIQMKDAPSAQSAKTGLHGQNIYNSCCTLHIDYSKLNTLNVKYNNEKSRDYTNPLLPAGDCPDVHMALGGSAGGIISGASAMQLAALAAAAGYGSQFTTALPAGYHLAPTNNPFLSYAQVDKYGLAAQLNAPGLLQTTSGANLATQTALAAAAAASNQNQQSAITTAAIAAAYGLQHQQQQQHHHHHQQQQHTQQQHPHIQQQQQAGGNSLSQGPPPPPPGQSHNSGAMLLPFLQNLSEDGYMYVYTA